MAGYGVDWLIHRPTTPAGKLNFALANLDGDVDRAVAKSEIMPYMVRGSTSELILR